jgi:hypothetical protein
MPPMTETFICDNCGDEKPTDGRELFGPNYWCVDCINHVEARDYDADDEADQKFDCEREGE